MRLYEFTAFFAVGWLVLNVPYWMLELTRTGGLGGWLAQFWMPFLKFPDGGTFWYWLARPLGFQPTSASYVVMINWIRAIVFAAFAGWVLFQHFKKDFSPLRTAFTLLLVYIAVMPHLAPYQALWLLPLFVLLPVPGRMIAAYTVVDLVGLFMVMYWFGKGGHHVMSFWYVIMILLVFAKPIFLGFLSYKILSKNT